ncbi:MAG: hypothetical protein IT379_14685 [Deltaproteobacteria bacterium]|nr:hypothetical protein [Deltaproteobacteria bacterium]
MTPPAPTITVLRAPLLRAFGHLSPMDTKLLVHLLMRACPTTGRVWTTLERLAEEVDLTPKLVEHALSHLAETKLLEFHAPRINQLGTIELGTLFVRQDAAPQNLPV